jgi:hypothetical protein
LHAAGCELHATHTVVGNTAGRKTKQRKETKLKFDFAIHGPLNKVCPTTSLSDVPFKLYSTLFASSATEESWIGTKNLPFLYSFNS